MEGVNLSCFEVSQDKWQFYSHFQIPWHLTFQVTRIVCLLRPQCIYVKQGQVKEKLGGIISYKHQRCNLNKTGYASDLGKMLSYI